LLPDATSGLRPDATRRLCIAQSALRTAMVVAELKIHVPHDLFQFPRRPLAASQIGNSRRPAETPIDYLHCRSSSCDHPLPPNSGAGFTQTMGAEK